jgi:hypothetical protein
MKASKLNWIRIFWGILILICLAGLSTFIYRTLPWQIIGPAQITSTGPTGVALSIDPTPQTPVDAIATEQSYPPIGSSEQVTTIELSYPPLLPTSNLYVGGTRRFSATPSFSPDWVTPALTLTPILYSLDSSADWFEYEFPEFNFKIKFPMAKPRVVLGNSYQLASVYPTILTKPYTNHPVYPGNPMYTSLLIFDNSNRLSLKSFIDQWQASRYGNSSLSPAPEDKIFSFRSHLADIGVQEALIYTSLDDPRPWLFIYNQEKVYLFTQTVESMYDPVEQRLFDLLINSFSFLQN